MVAAVPSVDCMVVAAVAHPNLGRMTVAVPDVAASDADWDHNCLDTCAAAAAEIAIVSLVLVYRDHPAAGQAAQLADPEVQACIVVVVDLGAPLHQVYRPAVAACSVHTDLAACWGHDGSEDTADACRVVAGHTLAAGVAAVVAAVDRYHLCHRSVGPYAHHHHHHHLIRHLGAVDAPALVPACVHYRNRDASAAGVDAAADAGAAAVVHAAAAVASQRLAETVDCHLVTLIFAVVHS